MESPALGIDLGTTNSVVAVADGRQARVLSDAEGRSLIPSVVSFHPDGSILVGHDARERRLVDASNTIYSIKRLIGRPYESVEVQRAKERLAFALEPSAAGAVQVRVRRGAFALPEISAMVLRYLRTTAEAALGTTCKQAVITVPANFNELQRSATQAAGKVAGLDVLRVLNEPTAATLAYGYGKDKPESIAVYDLGGGTFDLTLLDLEKEVFEVVSTAGDTFLGGDDIDVLVADRMSAQCLVEHRYDPKSDSQTYERLRAAAEWAKCQLSAVSDVDVTLEELFQDSRGRTVDFSFHMTREELDTLCRPLIVRSFDVVNDAMRASGRRPKEIQSVVLVGGSTRIPLVRQMVAEYFGREARTDIDPDLVVAQGAAIHAFTLRGQTPSASDPSAAAKALARAAAPKGLGEPKRPMPAVPVPSAKGTPLARVAIRKQPAFAPEHPRDVREEATRIAAAPTREPKPQEATRIAPPPTRTLRPAMEEATKIAQVPLKSSRGNTSPLGLTPAQRTPPAVPASRPPIDDDLGDEETKIGPRPTQPNKPPEQELSTPFVEVPSSVAVMPSRAIGVAAPSPREPVRQPSASFMDLDPVEALPPKRPAREPTMQIGTSRDAVSRPVVAPITPPMAPIETGPMRAPTGAGTGPTRAPTGTWALGTQDVPAPPAGRPQPPPPPPARPPDKDKIQQALFGGKPNPFGDAFGEATPPQPTPPQPTPPRPAAAPADPASSPGMSWSDFAVSEPPPAPAPLEPAFGPSNALPVPSYAQPAISPQAVAPRAPVVAMPNRPAPLLMDVTPLSLGLETVGGFVQQLVARNAPIPTEKTRVFSTGKDDQTEVEVRICQGDSNVFKDNQALGAVSLTQLRKARRGEVRIEVTFMIDASGILDVKATDLDTKRVQAIRVALKGGASDAEVEAMRQRQAQFFPGG